MLRGAVGISDITMQPFKLPSNAQTQATQRTHSASSIVRNFVSGADVDKGHQGYMITGHYKWIVVNSCLIQHCIVPSKLIFLTVDYEGDRTARGQRF